MLDKAGLNNKDDLLNAETPTDKKVIEIWKVGLVVGLMQIRQNGLEWSIMPYMTCL